MFSYNQIKNKNKNLKPKEFNGIIFSQKHLGETLLASFLAKLL
jgi:hypothetical protein